MSSYIGRININNTEYPIAQSLFGTCNTTANTATKVVTCADFDTLISGIVINVYFTYANTESSISLNVNSTGNKTVYVDNNSSILWDAGATKSFVYYNNQWRLINPTSVGTTYSTATTTAAGLMSAADKIKLNGITTGASTYAAGSGLSLSGTTFNHTNSITASSVGSSVATSGATLDIPYAKYDAQGHITAKGTHVHTIGSLAASAITSGTFATARIPSLPTSIITSGTFATARIPNLPASIITSGTLGTAILPTVPIAKGGTGATTAAAARTSLGLGSAAVASTSASVDNNSNLPTGSAIQSYVTGLGYEANQNAFTTVKVGTTDLVADSKTDTLTITAGNNITLTPTASSDSFSIAATNTTYSNATSSAAGLMSAADKQTLDGLVASGGEVNQNAFSNVVVGSSTVAADQKTDTLTLAGAGSVTLSANTSTDTITITGTDTTYGSATTAAAGLMSASDKRALGKWNGVALDKNSSSFANDPIYVPITASTNSNLAHFTNATSNPAGYAIARYNDNAYLISKTPATSTNSTVVATTLFVHNIIDDLDEKYVPIQHIGSISTATINYLSNIIKVGTQSTWSGYDQYINITQGEYPRIDIGQSWENSSDPSIYHTSGITMSSHFSNMPGITIYDTDRISIGASATSGVHITQVADPVNAEDAANKRYVDNAISGGILKGIRINSSDSYVSSLGSNVYLITHNQGFAENFTSTVMIKDSGSSYFYQAINDDGVSLVYTNGKIRYDIFDIQENQFKIEFSSTPYQFSILINTNYDSLSLVDVDSTSTLLGI